MTTDYQNLRLEICNNCPFNFDNTCSLCGCDIENKTKNPEESCPKIPSSWRAYSEPKVYKQAPQMRIAGAPPQASPQQSNECIPCKNRH